MELRSTTNGSEQEDNKLKIVFVPLDERPCNYQFPQMLAAGTDFELVAPDMSLMGLKKTPADTDKLWEWLFQEAKQADGAILSLDTLVYGGIIPSRLHEMSVEQCSGILDRLKQLKQLNPKLKLYAFNLIMRCPKYSSSDEEPDYYGEWGREIFLSGYIEHRQQLGLAEPDELTQLQEIQSKLPKHLQQDYLNRRAVNREVNRLALQYVKDGTIDFMIIPQDDSAPYGLTAIDQQRVRDTVGEMDLELKVYMYPGADEVACTLLARMMNEAHNRRPLVYAHFSSAKAPFVTPLYEDRMVYESIKYQILAAGGLMCPSLKDADMILCVNLPSDNMMEAVDQKDAGQNYLISRNIIELTEMADYAIHTLQKPTVIADIAFANGADLTLFKLLKNKKLLFKLAGYAGWNTSSNTLGTCIPQGMIFALKGHTDAHRDFLSLRFTEDAGYCSHVRKTVSRRDLDKMGWNTFAIDGQRGQVRDIILLELNLFIENHINYDDYRIVIDECYMPWSRMFEVGLKTHVEKGGEANGN